MTIKRKYQNKNDWHIIGLSTVLNLLIPVLSTFFFVSEMLANEEKNKIDTPILFQPPPGEEQPEDTKGGGSRDDGSSCDRDFTVQGQKNIGNPTSLTAIAPNGNYGLTTAERPTFWVNLPPTSAQQAILLIKKGSNPDWHRLPTHSQQLVNLTGEAGIVGMKLSKDAPALEIGKSYRWVVALVCGSKPSPNDPLIASGIGRIDRSQISRDTPNVLTELDKASLYAEKGIWYDALNILMAEKSSQNNWNDLWVGYLRSGGLADDIANETVIGEIK